MTDVPVNMSTVQDHEHSPRVVLRSIIVGLVARLTVVDLFPTQAILPSLIRHYGVTPATIGFAVNTSTMGMAIAGLIVGFFSPRIDRRSGILASLILLASNSQYESMLIEGANPGRTGSGFKVEHFAPWRCGIEAPQVWHGQSERCDYCLILVPPRLTGTGSQPAHALRGEFHAIPW